ncbi:peptide-methionine (R)-S-oxide reductase MsrB [Pelagibacteraceae bacterium]|nr:peptide-methionine (R)-S-oxide reductase MsrB [Pelagibacteraceae bacterium]
MKNFRRKFLREFGFSLILIFMMPYKLLYSATKKIINPDLSDEQKNIMLNEATERPYSSPLNHEKRNGFFHCANCGAKLFSSAAKFDSGTGWPSFTESLPGAFKTKIDYSLGMKRTEYHCANCGVHHGHVFADGLQKKRFCSNGLCLIFKPEN